MGLAGTCRPSTHRARRLMLLCLVYALPMQHSSRRSVSLGGVRDRVGVRVKARVRATIQWRHPKLYVMFLKFVF